MTPEFIAVHEEMTVGQALDHLRKSVTREGVFYVYVVDSHDHLVGLVPLRRLITADPSTAVHAIRRTDVVSVTADTDQEEVARLATKHRLLAVPVVGPEPASPGHGHHRRRDRGHPRGGDRGHPPPGRRLGRRDDLRPGGKVVRRRLFWLLVNLPTRRAGGQRRRALRAVDPGAGRPGRVHAHRGGHGGNAGIQTFTVIVRAMALGDLTLANTRRILLRETLIGLANGVGAGTVAGLIAYFWKGDPGSGSSWAWR